MDISVIITCLSLSAVDGDTVKCDGENLRPMGDGAPFVSGFDAPEIFRANCDAEKRLGFEAKARFAELIATAGLVIEDSGQRDATQSQRRLVWLRLPNDVTVGRVMIEEGLAQEWRPGRSIDWCS